MIGPVQEKETNAKAKAIKNNPIKPPLSDLASILFTHELGKLISKAPKNDIANTTNSTKNRKLKMPLLANSFKASDPKIKVIKIPNAT